MTARVTAEDLAVVRRLWRRIGARGAGLIRATRKVRVERARALARSGRLTTQPFLERGVEGLIGQRAGSDDPGLGGFRAD